MPTNSIMPAYMSGRASCRCFIVLSQEAGAERDACFTPVVPSGFRMGDSDGAVRAARFAAPPDRDGGYVSF